MLCLRTRAWKVATGQVIDPLADRLLSRGVSTISTYSSLERLDLIIASRSLRALLRSYERSVGREICTLMLLGEGLGDGRPRSDR
jgi:hypothetical protein